MHLLVFPTDWNECSRGYEWYNELNIKRHKDHYSLVKEIQSEDEKYFVCQQKGWDKKFLDNSKLKRHQLVHSVSPSDLIMHRARNHSNATCEARSSLLTSTWGLILELTQERNLIREGFQNEEKDSPKVRILQLTWRSTPTRAKILMKRAKATCRYMTTDQKIMTLSSMKTTLRSRVSRSPIKRYLKFQKLPSKIFH